MSSLKSKPAHQDHALRQERLCAEFSITANATPASKKHHADIPGTMVLRTEGKTADADAAQSGLTWTSAVDNNAGSSVFGLVLDLGDNKADKVYSVTLTEVTNVSASETLSSPTGATSYLTPEGNIAIQVAASGLNLASESPTFRLEVDYREAR